MASADLIPARTPPEAGPRTAFLVVDTESVPDGDLLARVKYPAEDLTPVEAVERARAEEREKSWSGSDFIPVTFQVPVAVCVVNVGGDFSLQRITCLDAPLFRPTEIVQKFWKGVEARKAKLVTFNGRCFDLPLLEFAAYRQGVAMTNYLQTSRNRFGGGALDLQEFFSNYGACKMVGGLNVLAKMIGLPGKMEVSGDQVLEMHRAGDLQGINDYCVYDTLDTYFIFLRSRVMTGDLDRDDERRIVTEAREFLEGQTVELPALTRYLETWSPD
jgi:predicted PolB exonuclease-like 3'-5' exonuclease